MKVWKTLLIILFCLIVIVGAINILPEFTNDGKEIGSNELGHVNKIVHTSGFGGSVKIAVISGMHSREKLHQSVLPKAVESFASDHDCKLILYKVNVTKDADDFIKGRNNGESLVHDYVVKDIENEGVDLVIIGHDHSPWYGEDYYIATPTMDSPSVQLANKVAKAIGFNYYPRNMSIEARSTSITTVDNPIVVTGSKVFVYEIPENDTEVNAEKMTYKLLEACFNALN